ncbi:MAG: hypothetical protein DMG86_14550 [Acidobacteria bacterium]|nr:MAG: hypothetical protein DMG86_14550 [Acidobacteriota bacterium]
MISRSRRGERGQTILLVAVSIVSLLAMAALAIDVVTLYTARSETQRAADAAALAGAKAFVDSGVTSDPTNSSIQALAQSMGTAYINATLAQNKIGVTQEILRSRSLYKEQACQFFSPGFGVGHRLPSRRWPEPKLTTRRIRRRTRGISFPSRRSA